MAGTALVNLRAMSTPDGYFVVKVEDVASYGKSVAAADEYLKASHREGDGTAAVARRT